MQTLAIDIETYSSADLKKSGVYRYVEAADFAILLFAYSLDGGAVTVIDLTINKLPAFIVAMLIAENVIKRAHNANFERVCLQKHIGQHLPVKQWRCTMILASYFGLPQKLETVSKVLNLVEQKDTKGQTLINYFCKPCKPTKTNGGRTRNMPEDAPEKWTEFKGYNGQDVVVEEAICMRLAAHVMPEKEILIWQLDQKINDNGVLLDPHFIKNAIHLSYLYNERLTKEAIQLTGLDNPNSVNQLKAWLTDEMGEDVKDLKKETIPSLLTSAETTTIKRVLTIRQELSKTSIKKYHAMLRGINSDNRVRGLLQYYGANRTGRWAGRLLQIQNLPKNSLPDLDLARQIVAKGDLDTLELLFGNVPDTLSQLIRNAFTAPEGERLIVSDLSAIEAVILAWLANEKWRLDVFNTHGKIYEASGAAMFKVPIDAVTKLSEYRQKAKIAELALGYQGGVNALLTMGAIKMGLKQEELKPLVDMWRQANRSIVNYWYKVGDAAVHAVETGEPVTLSQNVKFFTSRNVLYVQLPSGRKLSYLRPKLVEGKYGPVIQYEGVDQEKKKWGRQTTYGGKLVENIVQGTARDVLAEGLLKCDAAGYNIVLHVHDEIGAQMPYGQGSAEEMADLMSQPLPWAKGLPLKAAGYETKYYKKD